ncbi:MAG TPA: SulP family inorganic anion transporter [Burkholderiales bacterium]|nr:SulP family inorganic anion transporter [Burkholderiales bacterium]
MLHFRPRLLDELRGYDGVKLASDVSAGLTVAAVALPLAMAFAIASGLKPEAGLFTAIVAGFLVSALGGSRVQIGGPAGAFVVVVYAIVERYGVANLLLATMMAGVLLLLMGVFRLGNLVRFVPVSIVIGFTNGIAVLIILSQLPDLLGLQTGDLPADFFLKLRALARAAPSADPVTVALAVASLGVIWGWPRLWRSGEGALPRGLRQVPGTVVGLILGTAAVMLLDLHVATIGTRFGGIPQSLPPFSWPQVGWPEVSLLAGPAFTIALLGSIESLLCARVADAVVEDRHDPNQELIAQGIANIATPLFGGFCATGTIARTMTNVRAGAKTPVAGIVHALCLLAIVLVAAPLATHIPLATLAAVLLYVAYYMGEWHEFARLRQFSNYYRLILLSTFILTVVVDLTVAVQVGLVLACLFFIARISGLTRVEPVENAGRGVEAYRISGSLFFGAVSKMDGLLDPRRPVPRVMVLDLAQLLNMDTTGLETLQTLHGMLQKRGAVLILAGLRDQPQGLLARSGLLAKLSAENVVPTLDDALRHAKELAVS